MQCLAEVGALVVALERREVNVEPFDLVGGGCGGSDAVAAQTLKCAQVGQLQVLHEHIVGVIFVVNGHKREVLVLHFY